MKKSILVRYENIVLLALLLIASALVYLPRLSQIGYLNDDWYLMYSAHAYGPKAFWGIFSVDRPARALVMIPAYTLFGDNALYYNLSAYLLRLISSISFFWLVRMLWPYQRKATFFAALLFLLYPGFLSQINGIDYQSQMVSFAAAMLSIALSVKAAMTQKPLGKLILFFVSVLLGWFYLGLVEYFLGLEILRLGSLYILKSRNQDSLKTKVISGVRSWLPTLIIPIVFLGWRVFFFESERGATDIGSQFDQFKALPLATSVWWLVYLFSNTLSVSFFAWVVPFYQYFGYIATLDDLFLAIGFVGLLLLLLFGFVRSFDDHQNPETESANWRMEFLILGVITALAGLIPVILANRQADFGGYSRYTLASSAGSALILISIMFSLSSQVIRWVMLSLLVTVSVFTHHANAIRVVNETRSLRDFWWQVAWRVPQFHKDTTLVVNYPITSIEEDYFVWGPANLIYYPDGVSTDKIQPGVSAAVLNKYSQIKILTNGGREKENRRTIRTIVNYRNMLILSMPTTVSCVRVIDGNQPEISQYEEDRITIVAPYSDITTIDTTSDEHVPPQIVFGPEPAHGWCFYYEKASLARQRGDWEEVAELGNQALEQGLLPQDHIEWMPFVHAYARLGDVDRLDEIRRMIKGADAYAVQQICQNVGEISELSDSVIEVINAYCAE